MRSAISAPEEARKMKVEQLREALKDSPADAVVVVQDEDVEESAAPLNGDSSDGVFSASEHEVWSDGFEKEAPADAVPCVTLFRVPPKSAPTSPPYAVTDPGWESLSAYRLRAHEYDLVVVTDCSEPDFRAIVADWQTLVQAGASENIEDVLRQRGWYATTGFHTDVVVEV
jgi:hypothetical protein